MFSPLAFPSGIIIYDLTTFYPPPSHVALSPFELYREPLVIIALADGVELDHVSYQGNPKRHSNGNGVTRPEHNLRELYQDLEELRDRYPKALVHQLLLFDCPQGKLGKTLPEGLVTVPPLEECKFTTMKTIMCDISSMLLAEMTTLAKSIQALNTIDSPSSSQLARQYGGSSWPLVQSDQLSRRNSQYSLPPGSRNESPGGSTDRSHVRMSMPAVFRSNSNSSSPAGRPRTPMQNGTTSDPNSPDALGQVVNSQKPVQNRFAIAEAIRDTSRDRVSVQGFGSGSVSERSRTKGRGRVGVVIGSLYLTAGRWGDALTELVQAAHIAKDALDHLWHAKALDNIIVSMLMLAWAGLDFDVPQICYASVDKTTSTQILSPMSNRLVSLQNLTLLLPELVDRILNLYTRAANNTGESLPQFPFSESVIRFSKLLSTIHLAGGSLDNSALQLLVVGTPFSVPPNVRTPRLLIRPTRGEILTTVFRGFPTSSSESTVSVVDRTIILSGIASVLGTLGYHRKKAMILRELVGYLIPGLVQARIKGAAEMGVHPAAGLAAVSSMNGNTNGAGALDLGEGDVEAGVDTFLGLLGQIYGVVSTATYLGQRDNDDSNDATITRIMHDATVRSFGGQNMKMDILRSCINLSEALPDFHGVLRFTADLLRTAGSGVAPGPRSEDASPLMSREEQVRLATNISRTLNAARNLGVKDLEAEYWDEFLLRGVEVEALPASRLPIPHKRSELPGATAVTTSQQVNPFIYNPFLRTPDSKALDHVLVAGEPATFKVTLQNPYQFDVEIESIKLESEGAEFESALQKTVIGPYRTQILSVIGTPFSSGPLKVTGCIIRVRGCRERRFPIFGPPWSPQRESKIKTIGVTSLFKQRDRPISVGSGSVTTALPMIPPKAISLGLSVIDRQPTVVVKSNSLCQSAVMILEGERQIFSITLQNLSKETPVDLLLFSFKDSTQGPLQAALSNRDASPAELYECELIFARKQALRWKKKDDEKPFIPPGGIATFEVEILGRPGLTSALVQVDYAYLGVPAAEVQDKFHTRQVSLPLTITVNASIELSRLDVLPLTGSVPHALWTAASLPWPDNNFSPEEYCLLLLDLRNAWPSHLHVHLNLASGGSTDEEILPGNTSRVMFPIKRIFLENPTASIPALDPSRQRQFVVSTGRISADSERAVRESFWYREEILKMLSGTWNTKSGPSRSGNIELRGIRLSQRMIEAIKIDDVGISLSVSRFNSKSRSESERNEMYTDTFCQLSIKLKNRTSNSILPLLRIQPSNRNQAHSLSLDLSKKLVWNGALQRVLPLLPGMTETEINIGLTALARGEFEISASVEEVRNSEFIDDKQPKQNGQGQRPRANTKQLMDAVLGANAKERRIWCSRSPLVVVVKDEESESESGEDETSEK